MSDQFVDMLEAVQRPQVARLQAENEQLRRAIQQAAERVLHEVAIHEADGDPFVRDLEIVARFALAATTREQELVEAIQSALPDWERRDEIGIVDTLRAALAAHQAPATDRQP